MINVIGLGYIGLPTALMLASHGQEVIGTDYNANLVATLNRGETTFKEKGLDGLEAHYQANGPGEDWNFEWIADRLGLLKTAGSDFHGMHKPTISLGMDGSMHFMPLISRSTPSSCGDISPGAQRFARAIFSPPTTALWASI